MSGGPVEQAVRSELRRLRATRESVPALYELALQLSYRADQTTSARDLPGLTRELRNCLEDIAKVAPAKVEEADGLDDLAARRSRRTATA